MLALVSVAGEDWETLSLSLNPTFLRIIERSRRSLRSKGGLTLEELQEKLSRKRGAPNSARAAKPARPSARSRRGGVPPARRTGGAHRR